MNELRYDLTSSKSKRSNLHKIYHTLSTPQAVTIDRGLWLLCLLNIALEIYVRSFKNQTTSYIAKEFF